MERTGGELRIPLKNYRPLPNWGAWGNLACFNPKEIRRSKMVWEDQNCQEWREEEGWGGERAVWQLDWRDICPPAGIPQALRSGRKGAACNPHGMSGAARCSRQGAGGGSQRLALQGDISMASQLLCQGAAVLRAVASNLRLISISFFLMASLELTQMILLLRGAHKVSKDKHQIFLLALLGLKGYVIAAVLSGSFLTKVA